MRVLIFGGREFKLPQAHFNHFIDSVIEIGQFPAPTVEISGLARGADEQGLLWGESKGLEIAKFKADWDTHGKSAGFIRNQEMLDVGKPDLAICFPGDSGTAHMMGLLKAAREAGNPVRIVEGVMSWRLLP